jgi:cytochrome c oxidase subunit 3/cytochrome o ubiquinol oxidase subunit 3
VASAEHAGPVHGHLTTVQWGMIAFLLSEAAFFSTLIVTYVAYLGEIRASVPGPTEVFALPLVILASICLFSSSFTIHLAERSLKRGSMSGFLLFWGLTIGLGALFILGTINEWHDLITRHGLWINRNIFGTCYFTLVGFHAIHVSVGLIIMSTVFGLAWRGAVTPAHKPTVEAVSWYWHFVDGVWVVVFTLVYIVGR